MGIASFGDDATEALFHGEPRKRSRRFPPSILKVALRKLDALNAAREVKDLKSPPGNRLHAMIGDWAGHHSIRVNDQWRIVFRWERGEAYDVRLLDYHS